MHKEKSTSEERENFSNQALPQKSHPKDKHMSSFPGKVLMTILKIGKGGIQTK